MNVVRWDPFQLYTPPVESSFGTWAPPVDIFEKQGHLVIRAEVPGVPMDALDVWIENGVLTLHGERKQEADVKEENAHRMERVYGAFTRSFPLPTTVDAGKAAATYKDGVLEVTVPKVELAKPKPVAVHA